MDKQSKIELTSTISKQNEQLKRYESRLRDVVTAYKGLVREKEALEKSLSAITSNEQSAGSEDSVATLTVSMATLAAEKARMEEAFQNDKRLAREQSDKVIGDLQAQLESLSRQRQSEQDNLRAKLAYEIQEREREHTEHSLMLKELQMKLTAERRSKEKLEDKFSITTDGSSANQEFEKRCRDLSSELEATQRKLNRAEARTLETPHMLVQLQEEITLMKQSHSSALREERIKAKKVEESAKKICASQEERVATLEARLAELSETVGEYDRQRRRDQEVIQHLRESLNLPRDSPADDTFGKRIKPYTSYEVSGSYANEDLNTKQNELTGMPYIQELVDKIHSLKKQLIAANESMGSPIDVWNIFSTSGLKSAQSQHSSCRTELATLKMQYEQFKRQVTQSASSGSDGSQQQKDARGEVDKLKNHIKTLQDKVEVLNQQLEDTEKECDVKITSLQQKLQHERSTHQELQGEQGRKLLLLEQQLHTQRERYATLLGEREGEIRARHEREREGKPEATRADINGSLQEAAAPPHMLHYAHELARKDLEISTLRKEKHHLEGQLRDTQREATIDKERFKEVRRNMKEEIDRLGRFQSREGANLEYLKNVVLSYLLSGDLHSKRHMLKAIGAVLHFTDAEKQNAYKMVS